MCIFYLCDAQGRDHLSYSCRCSFLEIYNESISDLLNPSAHNLHIREDLGRGCFVDGLLETEIENGAQPEESLQDSPVR